MGADYNNCAIMDTPDNPDYWRVMGWIANIQSYKRVNDNTSTARTSTTNNTTANTNTDENESCTKQDQDQDDQNIEVLRQVWEYIYNNIPSRLTMGKDRHYKKNKEGLDYIIYTEKLRYLNSKIVFDDVIETQTVDYNAAAAAYNGNEDEFKQICKDTCYCDEDQNETMGLNTTIRNKFISQPCRQSGCIDSILSIAELPTDSQHKHKSYSTCHFFQYITIFYNAVLQRTNLFNLYYIPGMDIPYYRDICLYDKRKITDYNLSNVDIIAQVCPYRFLNTYILLYFVHLDKIHNCENHEKVRDNILPIISDLVDGDTIIDILDGKLPTNKYPIHYNYNQYTVFESKMKESKQLVTDIESKLYVLRHLFENNIIVWSYCQTKQLMLLSYPIYPVYTTRRVNNTICNNYISTMKKYNVLFINRKFAIYNTRQYIYFGESFRFNTAPTHILQTKKQRGMLYNGIKILESKLRILILDDDDDNNTLTNENDEDKDNRGVCDRLAVFIVAVYRNNVTNYLNHVKHLLYKHKQHAVFCKINNLVVVCYSE